MGRLLVLLILIAAAILIWKAFGPQTWNRQQRTTPTPSIKGPDDDPEFLWKLEKQQIQRRKQEQLQKEEELRKSQKRRTAAADDASAQASPSAAPDSDSVHPNASEQQSDEDPETKNPHE
ncbi:MAG: hypothetical protein Q3976_02455 [Corynebacterium sp.]|nr:hypothetical protein [Corynebacterium sp.]